MSGVESLSHVEEVPLSFQVLDVGQVSRLLRCSTRTVEDLARAGQLPGLKFGTGGWVFPTSALLDHLNATAAAGAKQRAKPAPPHFIAYARTAQ